MNYFPHRKMALAVMLLLALVCIGVPLWQLTVYPPYKVDTGYVMYDLKRWSQLRQR